MGFGWVAGGLVAGGGTGGGDALPGGEIRPGAEGRFSDACRKMRPLPNATNFGCWTWWGAREHLPYAFCSLVRPRTACFFVPTCSALAVARRACQAWAQSPAQRREACLTRPSTAAGFGGGEDESEAGAGDELMVATLAARPCRDPRQATMLAAV
jgi:hypothetical protein